MESIIKELRYLNSKITDRVLYLMKFTTCDKIFSDTMTNYLRLVKMNRDVIKFNCLLEKIEYHLLKKSHFNFVIHNIPEYGVLCDTNKMEKIGYTHIHDTFKQFGNIDTFDIIRGSVYIKFSHNNIPLYTHNTINNMMMGNQIINTLVV